MEAAAQAEEKKAKEAAAANKMKQLAAEAAEKEATATKAKLQAEYDLDYVPEEVFQALDHAQTCTKMSLQREAQTAKALNTEREKVQVCVDENIRLNKRNILLGHQNSELQKKLDTMRNVNYIQENAELKRKEGQMEIEQEDLRYQVGQLMKENKSRDKALATKDAELAALRTKVKESEMRRRSRCARSRTPMSSVRWRTSAWRTSRRPRRKATRRSGRSSACSSASTLSRRRASTRRTSEQVRVSNTRTSSILR